jgi:tetratricopeptide (TPR) repeat protein
LLNRALGGLVRGSAKAVPSPQHIRPELLSREEGAELARALLEWTEWPQVRLVSVLKEVAKEWKLPLPGLDTVTVNRWVTGKQCPTSYYVRLLLALLARLLMSAARDPSLARRLDRLRRRDFLLRAAAAAGVSAIAPSLVAETDVGLAGALENSLIPHSSQIEAAVGYLRRVFSEFDTADWLLGPQLQLPTVASHFGLVEKLLGDARGAARTELLALRTKYAEFAGWLHQDSGHWSAGVWWTERALRSARETGDSLMTAYLMVRKSHQAVVEGDIRLGLRLARAAQGTSSLTPKVRAVALQQEAYGLALAGQADECHRRLDAALELSAQASDRDLDGPARYCIPGFVEMWRATCLMELGRPRQAIDVFERELATLPSHHYRDRGVYLGRLAVAYATEGSPEPAVARGRQAQEVARATGSDRIGRELVRLGLKLDRWRDLPEVSELRRTLGETAPGR